MTIAYVHLQTITAKMWICFEFLFFFKFQKCVFQNTLSHDIKAKTIECHDSAWFYVPWTPPPTPGNMKKCWKLQSYWENWLQLPNQCDISFIFNVPTFLFWYMYITLNYKTSPADWERYFPLSVITLRRLTIKSSPVSALKRLSKCGQTPCMNVCATRIHCQFFSAVY